MSREGARRVRRACCCVPPFIFGDRLARGELTQFVSSLWKGPHFLPCRNILIAGDSVSGGGEFDLGVCAGGLGLLCKPTAGGGPCCNALIPGE